MSDAVKQFDTLLSSSDFVFAVYYRGHWCPFCVSYIKSLQGLTGKLTAAHGTSVIVTAEPAEKMPAMRAATGYTGEAIVDPTHLLAMELRRRGLLDVAISPRGGYEHDMAQPAVLVLQKDGTVLYDWAIVPSLMNLGGAKDRPALKEVWDNVDARIHGQPQVHEKYSLQTVSRTIWEKVFG